MALFPDEFPFKRPTAPQTQTPQTPEVVAEPVVEGPASVEAPVPVSAPASVPLATEEPVYQPASAGTTAIENERRRSPRQSLLAKGLVRNETGNAPPWKVDLINISMLGIRFRSTQSLLPGDLASVKVEVGPLKWATKFRVVHSEPMDDGNYAIGCQFISNELARPLRRAA